MINLGNKLTKMDIEVQTLPPYNLGKKYEAARGGLIMENELRTLITELLGAVTDAELLDLIYKILLNSIQ